jgi:hypothetical protein
MMTAYVDISLEGTRLWRSARYASIDEVHHLLRSIARPERVHRPRCGRRSKRVEIIIGMSQHRDIKTLPATSPGFHCLHDPRHPCRVHSDRKDTVITSSPLDRSTRRPFLSEPERNPWLLNRTRNRPHLVGDQHPLVGDDLATPQLSQHHGPLDEGLAEAVRVRLFTESRICPAGIDTGTQAQDQPPPAQMIQGSRSLEPT